MHSNFQELISEPKEHHPQQDHRQAEHTQRQHIDHQLRLAAGPLLPYHCYEEKRLLPFPPELLDRPKAERARQSQDANVWMPRIPVFEIPENLSLAEGTSIRDLGDYLIYNGHHRRWAAILAGVQEVDIAVLHCDEDLWLNEGLEILKIGSTEIAFHMSMVYNRVQSYTLSVLEEERRLLQLHYQR